MNLEVPIEAGSATSAPHAVDWLQAAHPIAGLQEALDELARVAGDQSAQLLEDAVERSTGFSPEILVIGGFGHGALQSALGALPCYDQTEIVVEDASLRSLMMHQSSGDHVNAIGRGHAVQVPPALRVTFAPDIAETNGISDALEQASARSDLIIYVHSATQDLGEAAQDMLCALAEQHPKKTVLFIDDIDQIQDLDERIPAIHGVLRDWSAARGIEDAIVLRFGSSLWGNAMSAPQDTELLEMSGVPALLNEVATRVWAPMADELDRVIKQRARLVLFGLRAAILGRMGGTFSDGAGPADIERLVQRFEAASLSARTNLAEWQAQRAHHMSAADAKRDADTITATLVQDIQGFFDDIFVASERGLFVPQPALPTIETSRAALGTQALVELRSAVEGALQLYLHDLEGILVDVVERLSRPKADVAREFGTAHPAACLSALDTLGDRFTARQEGA